MDERESFLRAIVANPDDDLPRLIFADWLAVHGEPERAEFIRVQCELAADYPFGPMLTVTGRESLRRRERELWYPNRQQWVNQMLPSPRVLEAQAACQIGSWRSGFVAEVTISWPDWLAHYAALRMATPLRRVRLTTWPATDTTDDGVHISEIGRVVPWFDDGVAHGHHEYILKGLAAEFPGIEFDPPYSTRGGAIGVATASIAAGDLVSISQDGHIAPIAPR